MRYPLFFGAIFAFVAALSLDARPTIAGERLRIGGTGASLEYSRVMAKGYAVQAPGTEIVVHEGLGSNGGIRAVAAGALDLAISGRPLKEKEAGQGLVATPFLITPFGFFTSRREPIAIEARDIPKIYAHDGRDSPWFVGETVRVVLRPYADSDLALAASYFAGLGDGMEVARMRPGVPVAQTDQDNAALAENLPNSLTTGTLLQMVSERRDLRPVLIDGVAPTLEAVRSGEYRFTKTLYIVQRQSAGGAIRSFAEYLVSDEAVAIAERLGATVVR